MRLTRRTFLNWRPEVQKVAAEYLKRSGGRNYDASAAYSYDAILVIADIVFNETGDNPNGSTAMLQILGQKAKVVWPKDVAEQKFVFPRPKA